MSANTEQPAHVQLEALRQHANKATQFESVAYSVDGRTFGYELPVEKALPVGSYVNLGLPDGTNYLGQISSVNVSLREGIEYGLKVSADLKLIFVGSTRAEGNFGDRVRIRFATGSGELIGKIGLNNKLSPTTHQDVFGDATIKSADTQDVSNYLKRDAVTNGWPDVGHAIFAESGKARVRLDPAGFNRHTFLCGQSRSGKSFGLGSIVEQLLVQDSNVPILILDPNSDFVHLNKVRTIAEVNNKRPIKMPESEYKEIADKLERLSPKIKIATPQGGGTELLRLRFDELDRSQQAGVLQLHPVRDLQLYFEVSSVLDSLKSPYLIGDIINKLKPAEWLKALSTFQFGPVDLKRSTETMEATASSIQSRISNLGVSGWQIWAKEGEASVLDTLKHQDWRSLVVDIGRLPPGREKALLTAVILNRVWEARDSSKPIILVIDEAHNVCPKEPSNEIEELATECVIRIAAEGLKYGIRLLAASQRPAKIHPNLLSQCENLILMKMSSRVDLEHLGSMFPQILPSLLEQSYHFTQGQALMAGPIVRNPTFTKFDTRLTREGGADPVNASKKVP